jgi:hypothetical protein
MKQDAPATECFHTVVCIHHRQPEMYNQVTKCESTTSFPFSEVHTKYTRLQNAARSLTIYIKVCKSSKCWTQMCYQKESLNLKKFSTQKLTIPNQLNQPKSFVYYKDTKVVH